MKSVQLIRSRKTVVRRKALFPRSIFMFEYEAGADVLISSSRFKVLVNYFF